MTDREIFEKETGRSLTTTGIGPVLSYWKSYALWLEKRSEWVSVEDRLPETYCIAYWSDGMFTVLDAIDMEHVDFLINHGIGMSGTKLTHWLPLPTPPDEAKRGRV